MDKKQQIEFLRGLLSLDIKLCLETEVKLRAMDSIMFRILDKSEIPRLSKAKSDLENSKKSLMAKIHTTRVLIEDIEEGEFTI